MAWSKESRQSRGYDATWTKTRLRVLKRDDGLCQPCLKNGRVEMAKEVDHIVGKAQAAKLGWHRSRTEADANLQSICTPCHKRKTTEEQGGTYREPKKATGLDGWPVE